jgi:aspartyl-tRNA(Asn)/glutamyl-tRNA(Gln) amidotransferase subunit B
MAKPLTHPLKIGLEVHAYLDTDEKLFCKCSTNTDDHQNTHICPICSGTPGSKPMMPNEEAMKKLLQIALILNCQIAEEPLVWNRKHYSWPDLPKGYQTTISGAHTKFPAHGGHFKGINITECHLEEDPAAWNPVTGHINYNRSGLPLVEIVTDPDFKEIDQVIEWLKRLLLSLSYIKTIRKNAGIKVDVNVSTYGERVEMKNINSLDKIRKALEYEISRQLEAHENGEELPQETRRYDETKGKTTKMRSKENAADYRFIPDPDLPVIKIDKKLVAELKENLPETPDEKLDKLLKKYKVGKKDAEILSKNLDLVEFFEELVKEGIDATKNISWLTIELLRVLNYNKKSLEDPDVDIKPVHLAELIKAVEAAKITVLKGKQIMNDFVPKSFSLKDHKAEISSIDKSAVENLAKQVIEENGHVVAEYKAGKVTSLNFLIGQVMRLSERRADFKVAGDTLKKLMGEV